MTTAAIPIRPDPVLESNGPTPDRLALAVVQIEDAAGLVERLVAAGLGATRLDAAGGFLRRESAIVLVAVGQERLPDFLEHVRATCRRRMVAWFPPMTADFAGAWIEPIDVEVGGAVVFVLPIERVAYLGALPGVLPAAAMLGERGGGRR